MFIPGRHRPRQPAVLAVELAGGAVVVRKGQDDLVMNVLLNHLCPLGVEVVRRVLREHVLELRAALRDPPALHLSRFPCPRSPPAHGDVRARPLTLNLTPALVPRPAQLLRRYGDERQLQAMGPLEQEHLLTAGSVDLVDGGPEPSLCQPPA